MPNNYYNFTTPFVPGTKVRSDEANQQFNGVEAGFDLLPTNVTAIVTGTAVLGTEAQGATVNEYEVTSPDPQPALVEGQLTAFKATHTNTGATTLEVDGLGAFAFVRPDGVAMVAGDLVTDLYYEARFDLANSRWQLVTVSTSYLTAAQAAAAAAAASAAAALVSEGNAATSAANAATSETNAAASAVSAQDWAIRAEDDPVPPSSGGDGVTTFSAFHWAQKSAAAAGGSLIQGTGIIAPSAGTPYDYDGELEYQNANALTTATLGWDGTSTFQLQLEAFDALAQVNLRDAAGTLVTPVTFTQTGITLDALATTDVGIRFNDAGSLVYRIFHDENQSEIKHRLANAGDVLRIEEGNGVNIAALFTPNAGQQLRFSNVEKLLTVSEGINLTGSAAGDPTSADAINTRINLQSTNPNLYADIGYTSSANLDINQRSHGSLLRLRAEDAGGTIRTMVSVDADSDVRANFTGLLAFATTASGADVYDTAGDVTILGFRSDANVLGGDVLYAGAGTGMRLRGEVNSEDVQIQARDGGGVLRAGVVFDPTSGQSSLQSANGGGWRIEHITTGASLHTTSTGIDTRGLLNNDPALGGVQDVLMELSNQAGTRAGDIGFFSNVNLVLGNRVHDGGVVLRAEDSGGTVRDALWDPELEGSGGHGLSLNLLRITSTTDASLASTQHGLQIGASSGANVIADGNEIIARDNGAAAALSVNITGGGVTLGDTTSEGAVVVGTTNATLYRLGEIKLVTENIGIEVRGDVAPGIGGVQDGSIQFAQNDGTNTARVSFISSANFQVRNQNHGGSIILQAEDTGGTVREIISGDPDALTRVRGAGNLELQVNGGETGILITANDDVALFDNDVEVARTLPAASGGFQINNTSTGAGFERALTTSDLVSGFTFSGCSAHKTSGTQSVPGNSTLTAPTLNFEEYDNGGWHDTVTNTDRMTIPGSENRIHLWYCSSLENVNASGFFTYQFAGALGNTWVGNVQQIFEKDDATTIDMSQVIATMANDDNSYFTGQNFQDSGSSFNYGTTGSRRVSLIAHGFEV